MEKRKETILATIEAAGALTDSLKEAILGCVSSQQLEDLYLPFRPRRRTRATVAREKGLEPLAELLWNHRTRDPEAEARRFVGKDVPGVEDALAGARDIIAERLSENAPIREALRGLYRSRRAQSRLPEIPLLLRMVLPCSESAGPFTTGSLESPGRRLSVCKHRCRP